MSKKNFYVIRFAEAKQPVSIEQQTAGYYYFGRDNKYPNYLLGLFNGSAKHNSIIKGKVKYTTGDGWQIKDSAEDQAAQKFIDRPNRYESLYDLSKKYATDDELFGGVYLEIIWSEAGGQITDVCHVDFSKVRTNKDNTQFWIKDNWDDTREEPKVRNAFNPTNPHGSQILFVKQYKPGGGVYSEPEYLGALNYILADVEVAKHVLGNAQSGFTPSKMISFTNGEASEDEKKEIYQRLKNVAQGANGVKWFVEFVDDANRKTLVEDLGQSDLTKEDFSKVDLIIQQNIYAGHQITSPILFGIKTEGQLGGATELRNAYEIFKNTYVNDKQKSMEQVFNMLAKFAGANAKIEIKPVEPIGIEFSEQTLLQVAPKGWFLEKVGIDPTKYEEAQVVGEDGLPVQAEAQPVNEHLKNLSGRQNQNMMRIVRQFSKGQLSQAQATLLLKGFGLSDQDVAVWLGLDEQSFSETMSEEKVLAAFSEYGFSKSDCLILKSRQAFSHHDEIHFGEERTMEFAEEVGQLQADILDLIKKDKRISDKTLADVLKVSESEVSAAVKALAERKLISVKVVGDELQRTLTKPASEAVKETKPETTEFIVAYSYDWKPIVPSSKRNPATSRPFCQKLMAMDKLYTRQEIETLSTRLGYSVFDRAGGWWNNNGETSPSCRHTWTSNLVIKKKK